MKQILVENIKITVGIANDRNLAQRNGLIRESMIKEDGTSYQQEKTVSVSAVVRGKWRRCFIVFCSHCCDKVSDKKQLQERLMFKGLCHDGEGMLVHYLQPESRMYVPVQPPSPFPGNGTSCI